MGDVEKIKKERKPSTFLFVAAISALFGAISMGCVFGWTAQAIPSLKEDSSVPLLTNNTNQTEAWIKSSTTLGALTGALASGPIAQILGRKIALIIFGAPMGVGFLCLWLAPNFALIIIGRALAGFAAGLISGTAPTYVIEISTEKVRGVLGTGFQLCITIGILYAFTLGAFISWSWLSFACLFPGLAMSGFMLLMPETPFWLMTKSGGDFSKGSAVEVTLKKLRAEDNDNEAELQEIAESTAQASKSKGLKSTDIKNPLFYKPFIYSILLMFFQQFSGTNAVMFNASDILKDAGTEESVPPKYATIIIGLAQVIATLVGSQLVGRLGRKLLLIGSGAGHAISLGILAVYYLWIKPERNWLPIVCLVVFIISFSLGWGPIPWLMITEITPMEFRAIVSAVSTGVNWGCAFLITHNFEMIQGWTSPQVAFITFSFFCVLSIPFVIIFLPETKGKPFDEILRNFTKNAPMAPTPSVPSSSNALPNENEAEMKGVSDKK